MDEAMELTARSLCAYGEKYKHWAIAFSGGKDSSATLTVVVQLIADGRVPMMASALGIQAEWGHSQWMPGAWVCAQSSRCKTTSTNVRELKAGRKSRLSTTKSLTEFVN